MTKTEKLKNIILSKYTSIREFARVAEIPSTTLTSALDKDIGGMAVDRVIKICELLNIDVINFEPLNPSFKESELSKDETTLLQSYNKLNDLGKNKVIDYTKDLSANIKYIKENSSKTLEEMFTTQAAHNDDLTDCENNEVDRRILNKLRKR